MSSTPTPRTLEQIFQRELTARDDAYNELATDCAELRGDVVRLTARAERAEAEVERLKKQGVLKAI